MDLLEYQAKELFAQVGIPVLPSQKIYYPQELKRLQIPYPIVLKSQVPIGGRGKAGGIKYATNTIDAIAAAQAIFHLPIRGLYPDLLLAESRYNPSRELYLAILLDRNARRPVLIGSQEGGVDVDLESDSLHRVVVEDEFSPFYARRLAVKMGLRGSAISAVSQVIEKMYRLFVAKDLDWVEINPLGLRSNGEVMALDGKVTVNDDAIERHEDLAKFAIERSSRTPVQRESPKPNYPLRSSLISLDGNIGVVSNGTGLTWATVDLIYLSGGQLSGFINIGDEVLRHNSTSLCDRLEQGLELMSESPQTDTVIINLVGSVTSCWEIARTISQTVERMQQMGRSPRWFARLMGRECDRAQASLKPEIVYCATLDQLVERALAVSTPDLNSSSLTV